MPFTLHVLSDLHLEMGQFVPEMDGFCPSESAIKSCDAVVLAGDIHKSAKMAMDWAIEKIDKPTIYVMGNHCLWQHDWARDIDELREYAERKGIFLLENNKVTINGVTILGCTLWTDYAFNGSVSEAIQNSDKYNREIIEYKINGRNVQCLDVIERHEQSRRWLEQELHSGISEKTVVVTHHAPSALCSNPRWSDSPKSAYYLSKFPECLLKQASLWIHGHTHGSTNVYLDNGTMLFSNPRGMIHPGGIPQNPEFSADSLLRLNESNLWEIIN